MLAEGVAENVGYFPMQLASTINLSGVAFMTAIASFGTSRFAVTSQMTGCCFVWDKAASRVGHVKPTGMAGTTLRAALGSLSYTVFGKRDGNPASGEYDDGEDVTIIGVNNGGWRFFAQVHAGMTTQVLRVVEL